MKVLHIISGGDKGGAKTHMFSLLKELNKSIILEAKLLCLMEGAFSKEAAALGIPTKVINQKLRFDMSVVGKIKDYVAAESFDIIHCHGARANFIGAMLRRRINTPMVTTIHSDYTQDFTNSLYKQIWYTFLHIVALKRFKNFIAISDAFKARLVKEGYKNVYVMHNGLDFDKDNTIVPKEKFLMKYNIPYDESFVYIGIVARLHAVKNVGLFVRAAEIALKSNDSIIFLVAGDGDEYDSISDYIESHGLSSNVFLLGHVNDIFSFYNAIDINTITSLDESFSYSLLEGAKLKKATVTSRVGGLVEMISDNVTGMFFESNNEQQLSEIFIKLVNDSELRATLGNCFYEHARENFSAKKMTERCTEIYLDILQKNKIKVLVSGYHGFGNCGDEATLLAMKRNIERIADDVAITVFSYRPAETEQQYNVVAVKRFNAADVLSAIKKCDVLLFGGGSLLQDGTSTRSLLYYLSILFMAKLMRKKVMLYANGIGPINKSSNRMFTKLVLNRVDIITLRESLSLSELNEIGVSKPRLYVTADPAFTLNEYRKTSMTEIIKREATPIPLDKPILGVSIREWKNSEPFISAVAKACDYVAAKHNMTILIIPMQITADAAISSKLQKKIKADSYMLTHKYNVEELLSIIGETTVILSMRLHALIFSGVQKIPMAGIVYDPKVEHYLKLLNMPSVGDIRKEKLDADIIKNTLDDLVTNNSKYKEVLNSSADRLIEKSKQTDFYLRYILNEVRESKK